jgi:hypothetical protein
MTQKVREGKQEISSIVVRLLMWVSIGLMIAVRQKQYRIDMSA